MRRRRLKALRWSLMLGSTYLGYKVVRGWLRRRREFLEGGRLLGGVVTGAVGRGVGGGGNNSNYISSDRGRGMGGGEYQLGNNSGMGPYNGGGASGMTYANNGGYGGYQDYGTTPNMNNGPHAYDRYPSGGGYY